MVHIQSSNNESEPDFSDPPLLNASGIHEPYALRSIIEVETDNGLIGLSDRIGALGGTLDITSPPSSGTVLRVTIPIVPGPAPLPGL